jgi:hypothetical protein
MTRINPEWELHEDAILGKGHFRIEASELTRTDDPKGLDGYDWPVKVAEDRSLDYDMFLEAYRRALQEFEGRYQPAIDQQRLQESIERGQEIRARLNN